MAIDEYEYLEEKIGEGVSPLDLLATLRESVQMHRRVTWVFAGSHEIAELTHAPWPSYLVSARMIEMPLFSEAETQLPGEWDYVRGFRHNDTQPPPDDEAIHHSLRRRLLVVEENGLSRLSLLDGKNRPER